MVSGRRAVVACVLLLSVTVIASDSRAHLVQSAGDPVRGPSATARVSPPSPRRAAADPAVPARGTLRFIVSPPQTVVTVKGETVRDDQVSVRLGESVVRFTAPGYRAMSAEARITRAGESRVVRAALPVEAARFTAALAVSDTRPHLSPARDSSASRPNRPRWSGSTAIPSGSPRSGRTTFPRVSTTCAWDAPAIATRSR